MSLRSIHELKDLMWPGRLDLCQLSLSITAGKLGEELTGHTASSKILWEHQQLQVLLWRNLAFTFSGCLNVCNTAWPTFLRGTKNKRPNLHQGSGLCTMHRCLLPFETWQSSRFGLLTQLTRFPELAILCRTSDSPRAAVILLRLNLERGLPSHRVIRVLSGRAACPNLSGRV